LIEHWRLVIFLQRMLIIFHRLRFIIGSIEMRLLLYIIIIIYCSSCCCCCCCV